MSSKSSILCIPCVHIFDDFIGANGGDTFCIDVSYGPVDDNSDYIEVESDSEFANLMRYLLKDKTEEELIKAAKGDSNEGNI